MRVSVSEKNDRELANLVIYHDERLGSATRLKLKGPVIIYVPGGPVFFSEYLEFDL